MSHRSRADKQLNKLRKALRRTPPTFIDLPDYLVLRRMAKSRRHARELMLAGKVKRESHVVGRRREQVPVVVKGERKLVEQWVVDPMVGSDARGMITVSS